MNLAHACDWSPPPQVTFNDQIGCNFSIWAIFEGQWADFFLEVIYCWARFLETYYLQLGAFVLEVLTIGYFFIQANVIWQGIPTAARNAVSLTLGSSLGYLDAWQWHNDLSITTSLTA